MPFKKGQSGNPKGRAKGSKNFRQALAVSDELALREVLVKMALAGDPTAMRLVADRLWPRVRAEAAPVSLRLDPDAGLTQRGSAAIDAALSGRLSVDALRDVMAALFAQARIIEVADFEQRLAKLEAADTKAPWETSPGPTGARTTRERTRIRMKE